MNTNTPNPDQDQSIMVRLQIMQTAAKKLEARAAQANRSVPEYIADLVKRDLRAAGLFAEGRAGAPSSPATGGDLNRLADPQPRERRG